MTKERVTWDTTDNYVEFTVDVYTHVLPPFEIPSKWFVNDEATLEEMVEMHGDPGCAMVIRAEFGWDWTEDMTDEGFNDLRTGTRFMQWLEHCEEVGDAGVTMVYVKNDID